MTTTTRNLKLKEVENRCGSEVLGSNPALKEQKEGENAENCPLKIVIEIPRLTDLIKQGKYLMGSPKHERTAWTWVFVSVTRCFELPKSCQTC